MKLQSMTLAAMVGVAGLALASTAFGASHREAPLIAQDPTADITDVYAFVSYDEANLNRAPADQRVTLIMNVVPGQDPADGPNYFNFADDVLYRLHIDNNVNGRAENLVYEFRFSTETRPALGSLTGPIPLIGNPNIGNAALQGISKLDGAGSEGITRRQTYTVTEVRDNKKRTPLFKGQKLVAVPSNVGPFTIPNYEDLASQGVYEDGDVRVFAGQRAETFYIDLGAVFDTVNLRRPVPALTQAEDADDSVDPFGVNRFSGFNIHTIAIELPISRITSDSKAATATKNPVIGVYASTSRQSTRVLQSKGRTKNSGAFVQVARMANPLVNELIINTPSKDFWNRTEPTDEAQFQGFYKNPTVVTELNLIFGLPVPETPRTDLLQALLKYPGQALKNGNCGAPCSELLRLDLTVAPTAAEDQSRLGAALGGDPAGFPNGRRPNDDVTDIITRVAGGAAFINNRVGDGVNHLDGALNAGMGDGPGYGATVGNILDVTANGIAKEFPFLPTPFDGRNRIHVDCGEAGANPCN
jgi:hypothetical protein